MSVLPPPLSELPGSCDWGYCEDEPVDWRLDNDSWANGRQLIWLPVCEEHKLKFRAGPEHPDCGYRAIAFGDSALCMKCGWAGSDRIQRNTP